jgi:hypothetical protein
VARRETNSSAASGIDASGKLFSLDEWQKFTAETIDIRKMVYTYRMNVIATPDDE